MESEVAGKDEFRYEFDAFRYSDGETTLVARSYSDEPHSASFLSVDTGAGEELLTEATFQTELFRVSAEHLRGLGKKNLYWLNASADDGTYSRVPERSVDTP
jgi:hypothetical protein